MIEQKKLIYFFVERITRLSPDSIERKFEDHVVRLKTVKNSPAIYVEYLRVEPQPNETSVYVSEGKVLWNVDVNGNETDYLEEELSHLIL